MRMLPTGGAPLKTPVGTLFPRTSRPIPRPASAIGTKLAFLNAMQRGLDPERSHLIPAFPYTPMPR